ncbi:reverse transcriptase domain-containing protein [Anaerovibrio slackiae]|uniref:reverse transcriptase domain-containing protein n=1 Tax=Anaerovibrio slackiae TaxID=2652309 RepID=UPI00386CAB7F
MEMAPKGMYHNFADSFVCVVRGVIMQASCAWKKLFTKKHLMEHYEEKIKYRPSVGLDKVSPKKFEAALKENVDIIIRKVKNGSYHFTRYKQLLFTKGAGKPPRQVCVPTLRDKLTASVLNELLVGVYGDECKTRLPQLIIDDITKEIRKYKYFIKLDMKSFYGSINQDKLIKIIRKRIRKAEIISLIENSIKTEALAYPVKEKMKEKERSIGIPEGLSISNALANIYMSNVDQKYRNMDFISYYRYVDDILILVNEDNFSYVEGEFVKDIKALGLQVSDNKKDKGLIRDSAIEYLGYVISDDKVTVRESSRLKIEQSIEELFRTIKKDNIGYLQWKLNLKITGFVLNKHKYGWLFFYSQITDESLLFHLDDVVKKLVKRYNIEDKIKVKRFVRSFWEMHMALHDTKYIPNLDNLNLEDKKKILSDIYQIDLSSKDAKFIEMQFQKIMKREIRNIERDIENIS